MAIKHGKVVTYHDGLPPTNSHESLKRWSRDKLKTYLHYQNAYGHLTCQGGDILQRAPPENSKKPSIWSWEIKLNILYLHLQKNHGLQTRQGADLP